jgi:hypothetical protein
MLPIEEKIPVEANMPVDGWERKLIGSRDAIPKMEYNVVD